MSEPRSWMPPMAPDRSSTLALNVGFTAGRKRLLGCLTPIVGVLLVPLVALVVLLAGVAPGALVAVLAVLVVVLVAAMVWAVLRVMRYAATLEGTELVVQHALMSRRADLATARELRLDVRNAGNGTMPRLVAHHDHRGRSARVWLRLVSMWGAGDWLTSDQLHALADAIGAGVRAEPHARQAHDVATALRQLADEPVRRMM